MRETKCRTMYIKEVVLEEFMNVTTHLIEAVHSSNTFSLIPTYFDLTLTDFDLLPREVL